MIVLQTPGIGDRPIWIAVASLAVSVIALIATQIERRRRESDEKRRSHERRQRDVLRALQGDTQAVAYAALQIERFVDWGGEEFRHELISSLCLAWILEGSDRCRALILNALRHLSERDRTRVYKVIETVGRQYEDYARFAYEESSRGEEKIAYGRKRVQLLLDAMKRTEPPSPPSLRPDPTATSKQQRT